MWRVRENVWKNLDISFYQDLFLWGNNKLIDNFAPYPVEKERKKAEKERKFQEKKAKIQAASGTTTPVEGKGKEKKAKGDKKEDEAIPEYVEETPSGEKKSMQYKVELESRLIIS